MPFSSAIECCIGIYRYNVNICQRISGKHSNTYLYLKSHHTLFCRNVFNFLTYIKSLEWNWLEINEGQLNFDLHTGAGRGGRKSLSGKRNRVICYVLYNASDIASNVPGLSVDVREFCKSRECLKKIMRQIFDKDERDIPSVWCCSNCD